MYEGILKFTDLSEREILKYESLPFLRDIIFSTRVLYTSAQLGKLEPTWVRSDAIFFCRKKMNTIALI